MIYIQLYLMMYSFESNKKKIRTNSHLFACVYKPLSLKRMSVPYVTERIRHEIVYYSAIVLYGTFNQTNYCSYYNVRNDDEIDGGVSCVVRLS